MLTWLYDVKIDTLGIRFVLFQWLTVNLLPWENIDSVREIGVLSPGSLTAYNFKSRFLSRTFLIHKRRGWFARKVLVTPKDPDLFLSAIRANGIATLPERGQADGSTVA